MTGEGVLFAISDIRLWAIVFVVITFTIYIGIAVATRVKTTAGFYVAEQGIPALPNGAAIAADWMSAASFISMAGLIGFLGFDGAIYLLGWTGGYVLLALLLAPYLRKYGKYTVPDFIGDRYSDIARIVAVFAAIFVSLTYVAGQMRGVGIVFSRFIGVGITAGVLIGMAVVFIYAVLGGMKGITWTQVAQYAVLIVAYLIPAWAIASQLTGNPVPQISFGEIADDLNSLQRDFGLSEYTAAFTARPQQDSSSSPSRSWWGRPAFRTSSSASTRRRPSVRRATRPAGRSSSSRSSTRRLRRSPCSPRRTSSATPPARASSSGRSG